MKKKNNQNFVQVNYNLMANTKLNSTQKLFISYIIGWQKNNLICKETNNNLALKFGMKYGGIRSLITSLNKFKFFNAVSFDFDKSTNTSGHEITVDEIKLEEFLYPEKASKETIPIGIKAIEDVNLEETKTLTDVRNEHPIPQYNDEDIIHIQDIMTILEFNEHDIDKIKTHFKSTTASFDSFAKYFVSLTLAQKREDYVGVKISEEQYEKLRKMFIIQT